MLVPAEEVVQLVGRGTGLTQGHSERFYAPCVTGFLGAGGDLPRPQMFPDLPQSLSSRERSQDWVRHPNSQMVSGLSHRGTRWCSPGQKGQ